MRRLPAAISKLWKLGGCSSVAVENKRRTFSCASGPRVIEIQDAALSFGKKTTYCAFFKNNFDDLTEEGYGYIR